MDEQDPRIAELLQQFQDGTITEQGIQELTAWYDRFETEPGYADGLTDEQRQRNRREQFAQIETSLDSELAKIPAPVRRLGRRARIMVAASLLLGMSIAGYLAIERQAPVEKGVAALKQFPAGSNKAELTLASGQKIILNDAANGRLATQGNTTIRKTANGEVVYSSNEGQYNGAAPLNSLRTPRGGQYHLVLADGTGVWLNAASSITYPTKFIGNTREVTITGELYFEVAHNAAKPFRVKSKGQTVEVLGTHFNINAYPDESPVSTTLLQGSVRVITGNHSRLIKPGQQVQLRGSEIAVRSVDPEEVVAWRTGYLDFTDADIRSVMRQISRWYDVDVTFQGPVTPETFTGKIPRSFDLARTVEVMQLSRSLKLTVQGRRIMVK